MNYTPIRADTSSRFSLKERLVTLRGSLSGPGNCRNMRSSLAQSLRPHLKTICGTHTLPLQAKRQSVTHHNPSSYSCAINGTFIGCTACVSACLIVVINLIVPTSTV